MATVFRRAHSPFWFASYTKADGSRAKKSTKLEDKRKALEYCFALQKLEEAGRRGAATIAQARKVIAEIAERTTGEKMEFHTCRGWLKEWVKNKKGAVADRTLKKYGQVTDEFLAHLGGRADRPLEAVTSKEVRAFRDSLVELGHSPETVNQSIRKVLTGPFAAAVKSGFIPNNPCAAVEALRDEVVEKDVFSAEQVGQLVAAADGDWKGLILAGYFTGRRLMDLARLTWEFIDIEKGNYRRVVGKTQEFLTTPLHHELLAWLKAQPRGIGKAPVFPSLAERGGGGRCGLSADFKKIMATAKITGRRLREGTGSGRSASALSFHSLRHAFNSEMANAGVSQELRQKLTGHASASTNSRYTHLELETLRTAVEKIPGVSL